MASRSTQWSEILPRIAAAAPHLTLLNLSKVPVSMEITIVSILDQFPHLISLHIHSQGRLTPHSTPQNAPHFPFPSLHRIETLSAVSELVEHFLAPANALPELHTLRVEWHVHTDLRLPALLIFLARIATKLNAHPRTPYLNIDINLRAWNTGADLSLAIPATVVARKDVTAGCARVTGLTLHLNATSGGDFAQAKGVAQLVAFFPQMALLSLHTGGVTPCEFTMARLVEALKQTKVADIMLK
ncbi:hypothetical protein C8R45DRAFT_1098923 [Mycena sanguinolenta]|nr:hypothetical protein C8R45DRAFT_1098923 [Mycena sanguinolenta]